MNVIHILTQLRSEKQRLDEAIITMQRLAAVTGMKRRGRPPKWLTESRVASAIPRKRKAFSAETRQRMSDSQKKRWAAKTA